MLLIVLDAARADHFSCYGYKKNTTPNIDKISREGVLFEKHFSDATYTAASVPRLLTSRYFLPPDLYFQRPTVLNEFDGKRVVREREDILFFDVDPQLIFLPEVLQLHGFATAFFCDNPNVPHYGLIAQKFQRTFPKYREKDASQSKAEKNLSGDLLEWISSVHGRPFFAYWHIFLPHAPYSIDLKRPEFFSDGVTGEIIERSTKKIKNASPIGLDPLDLEAIRGLYDGNLRYADSLIGEVVEELKKKGYLDNTITIITADHGESLGEHGRIDHNGPAFDPVIAVPLIISYSRRLKDGRFFTSLSQGVDVMPTILDLAQLPLPAGKSIDGQSLLPSLAGENTGRKSVYVGDAVRTDHFKFIPGIPALFDLDSDPEEVVNEYSTQLGKRGFMEEELQEYLAMFIHPAKERWQRKGNVPYEFFLKSGSFQIEERNKIDERNRVNLRSIDDFHLLERDLPAGHFPWLLFQWFSTSQLIPIQKNGLLPLAMSAKIPNDEYDISFLVQTDAEIHSLEEMAFDVRVENGRMGDSLSLVAKVQNDFVYSMSLGKVRITEKIFSFELSYKATASSDALRFAFLGVNFRPTSLAPEGPYQASEGTEENVEEQAQENAERLRTLGYF